MRGSERPEVPQERDAIRVKTRLSDGTRHLVTVALGVQQQAL